MSPELRLPHHAPRAVPRTVIDNQHLGGQIDRHGGFADGTKGLLQALRPIAQYK